MTLATTQASDDAYMQVARSIAAESGAISPEEHGIQLWESASLEWSRRQACALAALLYSEPVLVSTGEFYTDVLTAENFCDGTLTLIESSILGPPVRERDIFVQLEPQRTRTVTMRILSRSKEAPNPIIDFPQD